MVIRSQVALGLSLVLLGLLSALVVGAAVHDYLGRQGTPEAVVRTYFEALEAGDESVAEGQLVPGVRTQWSDFVANGVFNRYHINGIAVRTNSIASVLSGAVPAQPPDVTVFLEITQWTDGV